MNGAVVTVGLVACVLAFPAAAASQGQQPLEPNSPWTVDYGPEQCRLLRHFGNEKDGVLLEIASFGSRRTFRFTLVGDPLRKPSSKGKLALSFAADMRDRPVRVLNGQLNNLPAVLFSGKYIPFDEMEERFGDASPSQEAMDYAARPELPDLGFEKQAMELMLKYSDARRVSLKTGQMIKPLAALRTCIDNLETSWGLDPAKQKTLSRLAVPTPSTVKSIQWNYPSDMVRRGLSAYVPVRVMVDADGYAGQCVVQSEVVEPAFKEAVCKGMASRFQPARDAAGNPVASIYITNVVFYLN